MGSLIKTIVTKNDLANFRREIGQSTANVIKWMFIFGISQIGATLTIAMLILKK